MSSAHGSPIAESPAFTSTPSSMTMSVFPGLRHPTLPPRISLIPSRVSIPPRPAPTPTLPPRVRATRMMGTVRKFASRLARTLPRHIDVEDLVGAGSLGLADAFSRRGKMPGGEFEAFAAFRIRGAMLDELRRLDAMSRRARRAAKTVAVAHRALEQRLGRPAGEEEVAREMGLDIRSYQALRADIDAGRAPLPLSGLGTEDGETVDDDVPAPRDEAPDSLALRAEIAEKVNRLPERMRQILSAIYFDGKTLKEVGLMLGVSESRVCQLHTEALDRLRAKVGADEDEVAPVPALRPRADRATTVKRSVPVVRSRAA